MLAYKDFSKIIKDKRVKKGIAQYEMALMIPISKSNYCKIENGQIEPNFVTLQLICKILEIDLTKELKLTETNHHQKLYD
ncbi:MAG: helix-turn-helix domain-containing protein [Anaeroplasma sp.]